MNGGSEGDYDNLGNDGCCALGRKSLTRPSPH